MKKKKEEKKERKKSHFSARLYCCERTTVDRKYPTFGPSHYCERTTIDRKYPTFGPSHYCERTTIDKNALILVLFVAVKELQLTKCPNVLS